MGLAFCLDESTLADELLLLWTREMSVGAYRPLWTEITFADGSEVTALTFVSNPEHPFFEANSAVDVVAPAIGMASGPLGTNADYVTYLEDALVDLGLFDQYVSDIAQRMKIV